MCFKSYPHRALFVDVAASSYMAYGVYTYASENCNYLVALAVLVSGEFHVPINSTAASRYVRSFGRLWQLKLHSHRLFSSVSFHAPQRCNTCSYSIRQIYVAKHQIYGVVLLFSFSSCHLHCVVSSHPFIRYSTMLKVQAQH